jgi:Protein of unknown function (DUF3723)
MSVGEIYYRILCSHREDHAESAQTWWSRIQSLDEKRELKRLIARRNLISGLFALTDLPALWPVMRAGMAGSVLRIKCDEEIIRYWDHIYSFWSTLLGNDKADMQKLDFKTIETMELTNPANSKSDNAFLRPLIQNGDIFSRFSPSQRDTIWARLNNRPGLVPSFYTFFEDFKYLEILAECMKKLIRPSYRQTVRKALDQAFTSIDGIDEEANVERAATIRPAASRLQEFEVASRRLYLFVMRDVEALRPGSVLLERDDTKRTNEKSSRAWYDFAVCAQQLGFRSSNITELMSKDPDRIAARKSLLDAREAYAYQYDEGEFESYVDQVVAVYARAKKLERPQTRPTLVGPGPGEGKQRRSGRPYRRAYEDSRTFILLENMHLPDVTDTGELTPFFIRRQVYLAFWGHLPTEGHGDNLLGPELPSPSTPESMNARLELYGSVVSVHEAWNAPQYADSGHLLPHDNLSTALTRRGDVIGPQQQAYSPVSSSQYSRPETDYIVRLTFMTWVE